MSAVDWSRLQFATTSIYHFLFVPLTIGLAFLTAILQTLWYRMGHPEHLRLTRFFGTLLVINDDEYVSLEICCLLLGSAAGHIGGPQRTTERTIAPGQGAGITLFG
jgi:hypothetical protein